MAKTGFKLDFNFVPLPAEIWDEDQDLSLCEFRFLGYLCKQIRFGEALRPFSDEEMMNGAFEEGKRKDKGCGLSRNGIKQARKALVERGWITAKDISNDPTRPRWMYTLILAKEKRKEVSQRDTGSHDQPELPDDSAASEPDSAPVTGRQDVSREDSGGITERRTVSQPDTCNKEVRKTKDLDEVLESTNLKDHDQESTKDNLHALRRDDVQVWLAIKDQFKQTLLDKEWDLWVRPARLLKVMDGNCLLIGVPPNGAIMSAAAGRKQLLHDYATARGYRAVLTPYPDDWEKEQLKERFGIDTVPKEQKKLFKERA